MQKRKNEIKNLLQVENKYIYKDTKLESNFYGSVLEEMLTKKRSKYQKV